MKTQLTKDTANLINLSEIMPIIYAHNTVEYLFRADDALKAYMKTAGIKLYSLPDDRFEFECALGAIYQVGRIQGIREERLKKRLR